MDTQWAAAWRMRLSWNQEDGYIAAFYLTLPSSARDPIAKGEPLTLHLAGGHTVQMNAMAEFPAGTMAHAAATSAYTAQVTAIRSRGVRARRLGPGTWLGWARCSGDHVVGRLAFASKP